MNKIIYVCIDVMNACVGVSNISTFQNQHFAYRSEV